MDAGRQTGRQAGRHADRMQTGWLAGRHACMQARKYVRSGVEVVFYSKSCNLFGLKHQAKLTHLVSLRSTNRRLCDEVYMKTSAYVRSTSDETQKIK